MTKEEMEANARSYDQHGVSFDELAEQALEEYLEQDKENDKRN